MPDERPAIAPPNYTQIPNLFLDEILSEITSLAELKVTLAIMRQTFGYHKKHDRISLSQLEIMTGLSRSAVSDGITAAIARGTVERRKVGQTYFYRVKLVAKANQYENTTSSKFLPEVVANSYQLRPKSSSKLLPTKESTLKETIKESTPNGVRRAPKKSDSKSEFQPGSLVPLDNEFHIVLRRFCKCNGGATPKKQQEVEEAAAALLEHGATVEVLNRAYANYWKFRPTIAAHHKRSPTVAEVRDNFEDWAEISERPEAEKRMSENERRIKYAADITQERVDSSILALMGGAK